MCTRPVPNFNAFVLLNVFLVNGLNEPSFKSGWLTLTAQAEAGSQLIIPHDLGEYPVKVDVQIRVIDNGDYYIFTGSGSAHRDDDSATDYGGVVYIYNTEDIRVYAPDGKGSMLAATTGLVGFTGGSGRTGSTLIGGSYTSGEVKVRAWTLCDIGPPTFYHQWTAISSSSAYHEIPHNLGVYPDLVTVQIALDSTDYWSDAQGSAGISDPVSTLNSGGVLFGYDTTRIRLWASSAGFVFSARDGWGLNEDWRFASGQIRIICWTFPPSEIIFKDTLTMGIGMTSNYEIPFSTTFDTDDILVSTEITVSDGNNPGFRFYGTGNSLTDGSFIPFGGVVYVYTETQILLWRPSDSSGGKMVYHNSIWANGYMNQMSDTAQVTIRIMTASGAVTGACGHGSCIATMDPVNVTCTCDFNWTGKDCKSDVPTSSITTIPLSITSTQPTIPTIPQTTTSTQSTTTPTEPASTMSPTITILPPTTSTGTPPTTTTIPPTTSTIPPTTSTGTPPTTTTIPPTTTTIPPTTSTGTLSTTTTMPPTTTTIPLITTTSTAPSTSILPSTTNALLITTTNPPATTSNPAPVMTTSALVTRTVCGSPPTVANTKSLYDGTSHGNKVLYSCDSGYTMSSGDQIHTCSAGVWVGTQPVCSACPNTYTPVITTPEELNDRLDVLKKNTEVHVKNTTSYKRSLVCANDPRPSSIYLGSVGILILSLICIFPLLADGINLYEHCHSFNRDLCGNDDDAPHKINTENESIRHNLDISFDNIIL
ncbi:mucin-3A-like isoform X2 [Pecten maximus]|uniref:mucin-3A-like isoform X2 n=1 Tax=Pecten maximus TaxID=6579 RepID=UPI001458AE4B|nr:mucin-3A-like isoform X2 [Pecten maximus]